MTRVGCLGLGWIGRHRMRALHESGAAEIALLVDPDRDARAAAARDAPEADVAAALHPAALAELDGLLIATPSALHADQACAALAAGVAVFCEKPLGRDVAETERVLDAARRADRLLAVDLSYRHTRAAQALRAAVEQGAIGELRFAELAFHNAYGPDKPWFMHRALSGGGCLVDLGTHLVDLLRWTGAADELGVETAVLRRDGHPLRTGSDDVEDLALVQLSTPSGAVVRLACSWFLPAGRDCVLECSLYGSGGAVSLRNVEGSFYDFVAESHTGTRRERLAEPPDDWGGRAIVAWARRLADDGGYDPAADDLRTLAATLEQIEAAAR